MYFRLCDQILNLLFDQISNMFIAEEIKKEHTDEEQLQTEAHRFYESCLHRESHEVKVLDILEQVGLIDPQIYKDKLVSGKDYSSYSNEANSMDLTSIIAHLMSFNL